MADYRVLDPTGDVVSEKAFDNASEAYEWFINSKADNTELGWRLEVNHDGDWAFVDDTEGNAVGEDGPASV
ncbi:MAG: hypothetical protein INR72_06495 [Williamsia herbipolensis]|uniref:Uncharacterized protein n=1 Tax=Williamsia serinedens TaxID=391736 RepID=A0ABT1GZX5_9NOCA|nr:hypothetical protein [Williamsia serinedens]MBE7160879.1 hypothetical protein [Williamsia herbipolensis]MCP2160077.1 hypothetical protein [Williamsia serinedens]